LTGRITKYYFDVEVNSNEERFSAVPAVRAVGSAGAEERRRERCRPIGTGWLDLVSFALMLAFLYFRPTGLFGQAEAVRL